MEPGHIFVLTLATIITGGVTLSTIVAAWGESRKRAGSAVAPPRLDAIEARLARMEEAIESISVEMERVAEGQRFTARLLSERAAAGGTNAASLPAQQVDHRYVTPH